MTLKTNKKGSVFMAFAIIAIVVICVLYFGPILLPDTEIGEDLSGFWDSIGNWISEVVGDVQHDPGDTGPGSVTGYAGVRFLIRFQDGTSREFEPDLSGTYSIIPLSITFEGKEIQYIDIDVQAKLSGEGVQSWNTVTSQQIEIYKKDDSTPKTSSTAYNNENGGTWNSGDIKTIAHTSILGSTIDNIVTQYGDGNYLLQVNSEVDLTVTVDDEQVEFNSVNPAGGLDFSYSQGNPGPYYSITLPTTRLSP